MVSSDLDMIFFLVFSGVQSYETSPFDRLPARQKIFLLPQRFPTFGRDERKYYSGIRWIIFIYLLVENTIRFIYNQPLPLRPEKNGTDMRKLLREKWRRIVFLILMSLCIVPDTDMQPILSPALALFAGIVVANTMGNPFEKLSREAVKTLLKIAIVGLGFGIHADKAMQAGGKGVLLTVFSIALTLTLGAFLGRRLTVDKKTSYLIASGTAICGGSAIAAVSPLVKAEDSQISLALGTVFILNAAALFIFPPIGHALGLSQVEFGTWAAIAIHDTSSVVGAAAAYGPQAEATATTLKLARALWIIPLSVFTLWAFKSKGGKIKIPYFILLFVVAIAINTWFPSLAPLYSGIGIAAHQILILTLFLIGAGLSRHTLKNVGIRPLILGISLWVVVSVVSLTAILCF